MAIYHFIVILNFVFGKAYFGYEFVLKTIK